ncbi:chitobiase/beta-hexosaminidase C-terminal domain-containing protein [Maribacter sp. 2307ULW6-5]|uniref:chitobiase/beta-hexosaminidase C-terminal domain-containing protein n=1 Tax=Maribacter sp. 2307ULW6-5 TaxID=3386275 RepID=UPI0039BD6AE6
MEDTQMAVPILETEAVFFTDTARVQAHFSVPNAVVRYTIDGTEVSETSNIYSRPLVLEQTTTVRAKAFHPQFISGPSSSLQVVRTNDLLADAAITLRPGPSERYAGSGAQALNDGAKGTMAFGNDSAWLGFNVDTLSLGVALPKARKISKVTLSSLVHHGAWIFAPAQITVFHRGDEIGSLALPAPQEGDAVQFAFLEVPLLPGAYDRFTVRVSSLSQIPDWHQGQGSLPWFFVDEILVE